LFKEKRYEIFSYKINLIQSNQTFSIHQGSCLPVECLEKSAKENLELKIFKILNLTNNNSLEILDVQKLNEYTTKYNWINVMIIAFFISYFILNLGIFQNIIYNILIAKLNKENQTKIKQTRKENIDIKLNKEKDENSTQQNLIVNCNSNSFLDNNSLNNLYIYSELKLTDNSKGIAYKNIDNNINEKNLHANYENKNKINSVYKFDNLEEDLNNIERYQHHHLSNMEKLILESSTIYNFLQKFNLFRNYKKIFINETFEKNELKFMDFIRTLLCYYIVILHSVVFIMDTPVKGIDTFIESVKTFPFQLIVNASFIVDVFFSISAFFLGYLGLSKFHSNSNSLKYFFTLIAYRLIRIWPVVIANFLLFWKVFPIINFNIFSIFDNQDTKQSDNKGPVYGLVLQNEFSSCEKQWPFVLSFLTNFTYGLYEKVTPVCLGWYWYLTIDLQMYLIGILLIILYRKSNKIFYFVFFTLIIIGLILETNSLINLKYGMNIFLQGNIMSNFKDYYIKIYNRCFPFWIGFYFGINYFEYKTKLNKLMEKNNKTVNLNNTTNNINFSLNNNHNLNNYLADIDIQNEFNILQKFFYKLKIDKMISIITFIFSISLMLFIIFIVYFTYDKDIHLSVNFLYNFLSRKLFSFGFILFCFCTLNNHFKFINKFMSSRIFNLPSKLSFAIYLCHPVIIKLSYYSTKSSFFLDFYQIFLFGIGFCVISTIYAFLLHLFFEVPFNNFKPGRTNNFNKECNRNILKERIEEVDETIKQKNLYIYQEIHDMNVNINHDYSKDKSHKGNFVNINTIN